MRLILPLIFFSLIFFRKKNKKIDFYRIAITIYFVFLSLRFMQGTDYIHYLTSYNIERPFYEALTLGFVNYQFESLYNICVSIFKMLNIPFSIFVTTINLINLYLISRFFKYFSEDSLISLLLLYLLYGIVFLESALRQSLAISIILGICFVAFKTNDLKILTIGTIISFLFHRSSILINLLLIAFVYIYNNYEYEFIKIKIKSYYQFFIFFIAILCILINIVPLDIIFSYVPGAFGEKIVYYFSNTSVSWVSLFLRIIYFFIILYYIHIYKINILKQENLIYLIYLFGFLLYFLFFKFSILSRVTVYFEILEIVIFVPFIKQISKNINFKNLLIVSYCFLSILLFIKDGIETQRQSNYKNITLICPYYTYFNMEEAVNNINM